MCIRDSVYTDGTEKYIQNDAACKIRLTDAGLMDFRVAGAGTAGNAISFTTALAIEATGNTFVGKGFAVRGTQVPSYGSGIEMHQSGNDMHIYAYDRDNSAVKDLTLQNPGGNVGIGTTSPASRLHIESGNAHNKISVTSTASGGTGYDAAIDLLGSASNSEVQLNMGINGDADREQIKTYQSAMTFRTNNASRMLIKSNGGIQQQDPTSTSSRKEEIFHYKNVGTSFTDYFSVDLPSAHTAVFYEIITFGGDWSGHSAARSYYKGFMSGTTGYSGNNEIENSGAYGAGSHIDWNYTRSGSTVTFQTKVYTGTAGLAAYIRIIGSFGNITLL